MSWIYEKINLNSEKNGIIECTRLFGRWKISVGGWLQSGGYINKKLWDGIRKIPRDIKIKNALILGLGGGSAVSNVYRKYGNISVTAIEWDPLIAEFYRTRIHRKKHPSPEIIIADAAEAIRKINQQYDLIIVDLFKGRNEPPCVSDPDFVANLTRLLRQKGVLILNSWLEKNMLSVYDEKLSRQRDWKSWSGYLTMYRHFGMGNIGDPLPQGYVPYQSDYEYQRRNSQMQFFGQESEPVTNSAVGSRFYNGLFYVEKYSTDVEPSPDHFGHGRLILWNPITVSGKKRGWISSPAHTGKLQTGVVVLYSRNYANDWNEHTRRQLKRWREQQEWEIVPGNYEGMLAGVASRRNKHSDLILRKLFVSILKGKERGHKGLLRYYFVRNKKTGEITAGLAAFDVPETKTSVHFLAFNFKESFATGAGTALIDAWFADSFNRGIKFIDFDLIHAKGDPKSWLGFSRFKKQFNPYLIKYPKGYFKILRANK